MVAEECYPEKAPTVDRLLDTLRDPIRREIVHYFENLAESPTSTLDDLAAHLAERMPAHAYETLLVVLPQTHLPKLESRGWLDYETRSGRITYHGHGEAERLLGDVRAVFSP